MKLNRTKVLVISLVVITLALGGAALYIANRLQTQIQTPSSASIAPIETLKINKTACATGTKGQNGCDYIGSKGLQDAINDAKAEPVTLPLKSAKLTLTVKAGSYDFANSALIITDGPTKLDVDIVGESGTIFLGNKTGTEETLFPKSNRDNDGNYIDTTKIKSDLYIAYTKEANASISNITFDGMMLRVVKLSKVSLSKVNIKNSASGYVLFAGNSTIVINDSLFESLRYGVQVISKSNLKATKMIVKNNSDHHGIVFSYDSSGEISNSNISNNGANGLVLHENADVKVTNTVINDNKIIGIMIWENSTLSGTGNIIINNKFTSYASGVACSGTSKILSWKYNDVWNNTTGNYGKSDASQNCTIKDYTGTDGNISADPLFTNPASGDFTLKAGSPAINGVTNADGTKSNMGLIFASASSSSTSTSSSSATSSTPTYKCKVIYFKDAAYTQKYTSTDTVPANTVLQLYISRTDPGASTSVGVNNVALKKGTTRIAGVEASGNNYKVSVPADQIAAGANVFEFGYNVTNYTTLAGDWCEPFTITGAAATVSGSSPNAICKDLLIGTSLTNQAKKNTREAPLSVSAGSDIYITHTLSGLDAADRTRYLRIYNGQNKSKDDGSDNYNYTSYHNTSNAYQKSTGTGTTDIKFTYKLTYAQLFQADSATLGFPQSPAETPQWASGQVPSYVRLAVPVKPFVTEASGSYDPNCIAYVKRSDANVTLVNTSNAVCVGMTIGKNGGTQSAKKTRDNPLLVSSGDTINITHTLSGLSSTENYRTLRMYNAQNISATGDNTLNSFTSYYDSAASYVTTQRVANGSNFDFKYTLTYDQLFKADTTALVKAATPAETPQWASGGVPNLVKVAVPVKPFGTNLLGTYSANCLGYISRVGISLASTSGGTSGGTSGNGTSGGGTSGSGTSGSGSNDDLPATDLSAFDVFKLIGGAIFLLGGITIMKYRSRFENI